MSFSDQFISSRGVVGVGVQSSVTPVSAINKVIWPPEDGGIGGGAGSLIPGPTAACSRRVKNCLIQFRSVAQVLSPEYWPLEERVGGCRGQSGPGAWVQENSQSFHCHIPLSIFCTSNKSVYSLIPPTMQCIWSEDCLLCRKWWLSLSRIAPVAWGPGETEEDNYSIPAPNL